MEKSICGIIVGEHPTEEEALNHAKKIENCPYLITLGTSKNTIFLVFIVPDNKRWWLKYPETEPTATGLRNAQIFIIENIIYPKNLDLKKPTEKNAKTPCGDNCETCTLRKRYDCKGCPATIYYKE